VCANTTINAAVDPALVRDVLDAHRKGGPGSVAHACEYETAMMLHNYPERVQMDKAARDIGQFKGKYFNWDHPEPSAYSWQAWWSTFSKEGICGDAMAATPEFGALMFETTVRRFIEMAREFRTIPLMPRVDHH
jgi:creatinine amidohydrolase